MKNIIININDLTQIIITKTGTSINQILSINQIFSNHIHKTKKDNPSTKIYENLQKPQNFQTSTQKITVDALKI